MALHFLKYCALCLTNVAMNSLCGWLSEVCIISVYLHSSSYNVLWNHMSEHLRKIFSVLFYHKLILLIGFEGLFKLQKYIVLGRLGGSAVEHLPSAQGVILGSQGQVPHWAPHREPASHSACVSASLCVSLE